MKVICISGKAQNGKDTTANILKGFMEHDNYKVRIIHYADLLKFICRSIFAMLCFTAYTYYLHDSISP